MTSVEMLPPALTGLYTEAIRHLYEIHDWRNASAILRAVHPCEWDELIAVLGAFRLRRNDIARGGGNKSPVARELDDRFLAFGWRKETFDTKVTVTTRETATTTTYDVPTHEVDCFKNRIALEVEWNNKDPFYDRDLNNFRLLFELRAIDLGIIITRTDDLQSIFRMIGRGDSFGESTTHLGKLLPKLDGGGAGGCPVIVFGIKPSLYVEDEALAAIPGWATAGLWERAARIDREEA